MSEIAFLRAVNGVVSLIKPPISLLFYYPPIQFKFIEYFYPSISALWLSQLSFPIYLGLEIIPETRALHRIYGQRGAYDSKRASRCAFFSILLMLFQKN